MIKYHQWLRQGYLTSFPFCLFQTYLQTNFQHFPLFSGREREIFLMKYGGGLKFSIFKINGTTSFYDSKQQDLIKPLEEISKTQIIRNIPLSKDTLKAPLELPIEIQRQIVKKFYNIFLKALSSAQILTPTLSFAWEAEEKRTLLLNTFNVCLNSLNDT